MLMPLSKLLQWLLLMWLALAGPGAAAADLVLIANAELALDSLSRQEAINIYMGRLRQFPFGEAAQPLDLPADGGDKALFYRLLINKGLAEVEAYWARVVFSGRASPPNTLEKPQDVVEHVARDRNAIGYVDRSLLDKRVKVILDLSQGAR